MSRNLSPCPDVAKKALEPMEVTEAGMETCASMSAPAKANLPMAVKCEGSTTLLKSVQAAKQDSGMVSINGGMTTC